MVKQPTSEQSEFTMSSEDFPALPGTSGGGAPPATAASHNDLNHVGAPPIGDKPRKGIQTSLSPDGNSLKLCRGPTL